MDAALSAAAVVLFVATYAIVAVGRLPGFRLDRTGAAMAGAALMIASGVLPLDAAYRAIDFDTIALLLGMMILVANLRLAGFFRAVNGWVAPRARHPLALLATVALVSGTLSAFLVNDTVCLVLTPLVLDLAVRLRRRPQPYLLAVAMASNVGSTATITGNPQNMIIGSLSHLPYGRFAGALAPVAAVGLVLTVALIALAYRREILQGAPLAGEAMPARVNRPVLSKALLVTAATVAAFFAGVAPARAALAGGAVLLITRRVKADKVYREIDGRLLLMFAGLFVVVAGAEQRLLTPDLVATVTAWHLDRLPMLALVTAVLSNLVSNVPAVLVLKPFVAALPDPGRAWLGAAMASTLAGNFTILGSVANLIVVQRARADGIEIGFWEYLKVGAPLTVLTILAGVLWL